MRLDRLAGRRALVTGASSGLGREFAIAAQGHVGPAKRCQFLKPVDLLPVVVEVGRRMRPAVGVHRGVKDPHQPVRFRVRQEIEQQRMDRAEDGSVHANAQTEREHG